VEPCVSIRRIEVKSYLRHVGSNNFESCLDKLLLRASGSAEAKGPGVPGGGTGAPICFLTVAKSKSSSKTLEGADHTAAESLPSVTN
jgi:hypothetical protein